MFAATAIAAAVLIPLVSGHGAITFPRPRNNIDFGKFHVARDLKQKVFLVVGTKRA